MDVTEVRRLLVATGEEITDDQGTMLGYVSQPARFRLNAPHLARGGFLIVERDDESEKYVATEFDALPHPKNGEPYPAGYSEVIWRVHSIEEAVSRVLACFRDNPL